MADLLTSKPASGQSELHADQRTALLAHKTELISELTAAVANQFNNFMMAITSYAELEMKKASASQRKSLEQVLSNAGQATALVQKLLAISRKQAVSAQAVDLNHVLTGVRNLLEQLIGERVSVVYQLDANLPMVNVDPAEIEQVVLGLALNARNAMAEGGKLTLATELTELDSEVSGAGKDQRKYVTLSIADTGRASTTEETEDLVANHAQDSRVNLSLAAVRGIVKNAGGWVRFSSEPETGSNFKIHLPALKQDDKQDNKRRSLRNVPVARTILVVEDDDAVRIPTSEFLKMEGFKVLQARTGDEALYVAQQNRSRLDVLITDIVMPKMTGLQVAEKLLELHSDLKVLYMSGDETHPSRTTGALKNAVLRKPFRLETLTARIHELLGE